MQSLLNLKPVAKKSSQKRLQRLASALAKGEGKVSQVKIGDIREIIRVLTLLEVKAYNKKGVWTASKSPAALIFLEANSKVQKPKKS